MLKDKNGSEIPNGSWFVFITKVQPNKVWGGEHSIREMANSTFVDPEPSTYRPFLKIALYRNVYIKADVTHKTREKEITNNVFKTYDVLLIPDSIRDLGLKAVVSYLRLGGLEIPNEITKLIKEDVSNEE